MPGPTRLTTSSHRAGSVDHIRFSKLTQTPKQFHAYRHVGSVPHAINTHHSRKVLSRTRAALEDPPRSNPVNRINQIDAPYEVDKDLFGVLSLASDEELEDLYSSLYGKKTKKNASRSHNVIQCPRLFLTQ
jgi:hypothetical protein